MTTKVEEAPTLQLQDVKKKLIKELTDHDTGSGKLLGSTVVTCFKNVICMDLRTRIESLPGSLLSVYSLASVDPGRLQDLEGLVASISKVRG